MKTDIKEARRRTELFVERAIAELADTEYTVTERRLVNGGYGAFLRISNDNNVHIYHNRRIVVHGPDTPILSELLAAATNPYNVEPSRYMLVIADGDRLGDSQLVVELAERRGLDIKTFPVDWSSFDVATLQQRIRNASSVLVEVDDASRHRERSILTAGMAVSAIGPRNVWFTSRHRDAWSRPRAWDHLI